MTKKGYPTVAHRTLRIWASVIGLSLLLAAPAQAQSYTIAPDPFLTVLDNSGLIVVGGCVWTYAAGTTTPITTYSNNSGTVNSNPIIADTSGRYTAFLLAGTNYKFVYETACTPPAHGSVLRTADGIAGTPSTAATVDIPTAVAGETIGAGQCGYLSDGSGGKTSGLWYKCDSANTYSSTTPPIGIASTAITISNTGTIRQYGALTGLSSLSVGADYYVGTAGALTTTAPTNARHVGRADTATSLDIGTPRPLVLTAGAGITLTGTGSVVTIAASSGFFDDFRLSPTSGTCVTDASAVTTLYLALCGGNRITVFNTSGTVETCASAELSIAVPATTAQNYDVWVYDTTFGNCTLALELLATSRTDMTGLTRINGRWTKTGDSSRLYVGSFRTTAVSGQTEDSLTKRLIWNHYNRMRRPLQKFESTASWSYNGVVRQANGAAANQVEVLVGVAEPVLSLFLQAATIASTNSTVVSIGIGEDTTTAYTVAAVISQSVSNVGIQGIACALNKVPAVGRHFYAWNEFAGAANTFVGANASAGSTITPGLTGFIDG